MTVTYIFFKQFWQIESYGTSKDNPERLLRKSEQNAIEILNKTVCKEKSGLNLVGLLSKNEFSTLQYKNCSFMVNVVRK